MEKNGLAANIFQKSPLMRKYVTNSLIHINEKRILQQLPAIQFGMSFNSNHVNKYNLIPIAFRIAPHASHIQIHVNAPLSLEQINISSYILHLFEILNICL